MALILRAKRTSNKISISSWKRRTPAWQSRQRRWGGFEAISHTPFLALAIQGSGAARLFFAIWAMQQQQAYFFSLCFSQRRVAQHDVSLTLSLMQRGFPKIHNGLILGLSSVDVSTSRRKVNKHDENEAAVTNSESINFLSVTAQKL